MYNIFALIVGFNYRKCHYSFWLLFELDTDKGMYDEVWVHVGFIYQLESSAYADSPFLLQL